MPKRMDLPWLEDKLTRLLARLNIEDVAWAVWITLTLLGQGDHLQASIEHLPREA